jgi:hypothetical protein
MEEFEGSLQREVVSILRQALLLVEKCFQTVQALQDCSVERDKLNYGGIMYPKFQVEAGFVFDKDLGHL